MRKMLYQIGGMAYYEARMQWRQRAMPAVTIGMLVLLVLAIVLIRNEVGGREAVASKSGDTASGGVINLTFTIVGTTLAMMIPVIMADAIPKDRRIRVRDLLDSFGMPPTVYLTGKMLGGWLTISIVMLIIALVVGGLWWGLIGALNLGDYLEMWLLGALPMLMINSGLIILLTANVPDSRWAALVGLAFCYAVPLLIGFEPSGNWRDMFSALRPGIFFRYSGILESENYAVLTLAETILSGLVQLGLVWVIVVHYKRRSEN